MSPEFHLGHKVISHVTFMIQTLACCSKKWVIPGRVVQLVGTSSHTPKCFGFDSQSGHIPRLRF